MKHMLLLATTFLVLSQPVLGMEENSHHKRTITIILNFDKLKSEPLRLNQYEPDQNGSFLEAPPGTYNHDRHTLIFNEIMGTKGADRQLTTKYCYSNKFTPNDETYYTHEFKYTIPDGDTDVNVYATLLSIKKEFPLRIGFGKTVKIVYDINGTSDIDK